jgi:hypothetical protein
LLPFFDDEKKGRVLLEGDEVDVGRARRVEETLCNASRKVVANLDAGG